MSGSNCCDPETVHLFLRKPDGTFAARREIKFERPGRGTDFGLLERGRTRPHLLDWDRDGHVDLVIGYVGSSEVLVSRGPLAGKADFPVKPVALPAPPHTHPIDVRFADWDGDGAVDLLAAVQYRSAHDRPWRYGVDLHRNTAATGEPTFAAAAGERLVILPEPWEVHALAVDDRDGDGRPDLVVGVYKDWKRVNRRWTGDSQLWLYRRRG